MNLDGSMLGPYKVVGLLGAGAMGEVYRARDTRLGREVAVKVLPELFSHDPDRRARFEREARAVAALSHPNILAIHDYGTHGTITYAVMELLEGETLRSRLARGPLSWRDAVEIGAAIAEGLAAAHTKGIVHRDLKPENLLLTTDGRTKVLDFGLARITPLPSSLSETGPFIPSETEAGTVMGTAGYMSPEQVCGQPADARSDLFSFGCVLYEMVSGRPPFQRATVAETMTATLHDEPADPAGSGTRVPPELGRVIRHCLAKSPNLRLHSARDLALGLRAAASDPRLPSRAARRPSRRVAVLAAVALAALTGASAYLLTQRGSTPQAGKPAEKINAVEALAVLPFENVGGDPKMEYLSDGVADHLINSFSQMRRRDLKVRPFTSVSRYKKQKADVPTVGRELNVQVVVTGTLHQEGDDLAISVALVDAREDNHLWGQRYQGKRGGILDLQDQIARDVTANLRLELTGEEEKRLTKRYTEDPEAYLLYQEGAYHWNKYRLDSIRTAIDYFQRAIEKDPSYALAHLGLGRCQILLGSIHLGPRQTHPEGRKSLNRALEIDDGLPEAHSGLAMIHMVHDWNWAEAEREVERAIALGSNEFSENRAGFYLGAMGRTEAALVQMQRNVDLNPLTPRTRNELAMCYNWMRMHDQAITEARKALELDPNFPLAPSELGLAQIQKGSHEEAMTQLRRSLDLGHDHPRTRGMLGCAYAHAGKKAEAERVLEELQGLSPGRFGIAFSIARIHGALGEMDPAFQWLRKAADERDPSVIWLKVDPTMDSLRPDARFAQTLKEMGLPP